MKTFFAVCAFLLVACSNRTPLPPDHPNRPASLSVPVDAGTPTAQPTCQSTPAETWEVHFSPDGGCTEAVVKHIDAAHKIRVQAYGFTSTQIADALIKAKQRGADVEVILDRSDKTAKNSKAGALMDAKIPVYFDEKHQIAHNKVMIYDDNQLETGSFNYTDSAEKHNAENCLFSPPKPELAAEYSANWEEHKNHSKLAN